MIVAKGLANDNPVIQEVSIDVSEDCHRVTISLISGAITLRGIFTPKAARHVAAVLNSYADAFDPRR